MVKWFKKDKIDEKVEIVSLKCHLFKFGYFRYKCSLIFICFSQHPLHNLIKNTFTKTQCFWYFLVTASIISVSFRSLAILAKTNQTAINQYSAGTALDGIASPTLCPWPAIISFAIIPEPPRHCFGLIPSDAWLWRRSDAGAPALRVCRRCRRGSRLLKSASGIGSH